MSTTRFNVGDRVRSLWETLNADGTVRDVNADDDKYRVSFDDGSDCWVHSTWLEAAPAKFKPGDRVLCRFPFGDGPAHEGEGTIVFEYTEAKGVYDIVFDSGGRYSYHEVWLHPVPEQSGAVKALDLVLSELRDSCGRVRDRLRQAIKDQDFGAAARLNGFAGGLESAVSTVESLKRRLS